MVTKIFSHGKRILFAPQASILSAASVIMLMVVFSRILGLIRQRVLLSYFLPEDLSLFFAAFRLPDLVFEVLTLGALSSAFIPVFTSYLKKDEKEAWQIASRIMNLGLLIFVGVAFIFSFSSEWMYGIVAAGFEPHEAARIAGFARILFAAQGFFLASYVITGDLESMRMFFVPAMAPLLYNLGIIFGTVVLNSRFGLYAPAIGVVIGAFLHFLIQLPFAYRLGFRFTLSFKPDRGVREIAKLAGPRVVELGVLQLSKTVELYLASLISTAAYTYFTLANAVQMLPVGVFGVSLAKAAFPSLTREANEPQEFKRILLTTLYQVFFLIMPLTTILIVLRVPVVRLLFGTDIFGWKATVQTGFVLSAFAIGVPAQASVMLLNRAFYALHDTRTPMAISLAGTSIATITSMVLILGFG